MIVRILWKSKTFRAIRYNTTKVEKNKGELVKVSGFGALQALSNLRPEDYINYLSAVSKKNTRIVFPQFHAMISAKGKSATKEELTSIADKWLTGMGYGDQPYLLIFHKDTGNNHIHMVSTRVDRSGNKISDSFEKIRSYQVLNSILGKDEKRAFATHTQRVLKYGFSTKAQFMMLMERMGYALSLKDDAYHTSKFGKHLGSIPLKSIEEKLSAFTKNSARSRQLQTIFLKYGKTTGNDLIATFEKLAGNISGKHNGYTSPLCDLLSEKFGLEFIFHFKADLMPYGYTVIDHAYQSVFKGSEIMPLAQFLSMGSEVKSIEKQQVILLEVPVINDEPIFMDAPSENYLLNYNANEQYSDEAFEENTASFLDDISIDIADDIDDEQILGRNRRRQKKARTNTR